ncbi:MAG: DNA-processing protein DprA [Spirochaetes bacterium]|nr:DNA-processing protein DprA [Spirochaetota bacterium]
MAEADDAGVLAIAIDRASCLGCLEKAVLFEALGATDRLASLSEGHVSSLIGRRYSPTVAWNPSDLLAAAERDMTAAGKRGSGFVRIGTRAYPAALAETSRPPFLLYYRGRMPDPDAPAIAIVGTRYPTGAGLDEAARLSGAAAEAGIQVVSGLARGIDAAAHSGAVEAGYPTFAVLACGVDSVYPQRNRGLASRMIETGGAILSEYPPGTQPLPFRFPERNRIIAGLCFAVIVVEAPERSGALITAQFALDEGRDVCVAASRLSGPRSAGCERLANEGAVAIGDIRDALAGRFARATACETT